jgi:hypothetical protein
VIDLTLETTISLAAAGRLVPPARRGRRTHLSTLLRWVSRGTRAPSGQRVRLEAVRLGNRWVTSREALQRFAAALTPQFADTPPTDPRTPGQRRRASERVAARLEAAGI